jgi:iron complex outermembrane receptor protein
MKACRLLSTETRGSSARGRRRSAAAPESFSLWDASVALIDREGRYRLAFIAKNIGDTFYTTAKIPSTYIRQQVPRDSERYFGISLRANFGR